MEKPIPNESLTENELKRISELTEKEIEFIDESILSCVKGKYLKQVRIIIEAKGKVEKKLKEIPLTYYSLRIQELEKKNLVKTIGNLNLMRFSEVKIPN